MYLQRKWFQDFSSGQEFNHLHRLKNSLQFYANFEDKTTAPTLPIKLLNDQ